jgi:hypothetical protein
MPGPAGPGALYVGDRRVAAPSSAGDPPVALPSSTTIHSPSGSVWAGILPLARDQMGARRGLELRVLPTGELALAMPHYRGPEKWFWDYQSPHAAFYRRNIRSGTLIVVAERTEYPDVAAFSAHLGRARVTDALAPDGVRTVGYRNQDAWLELRYDLVRNETVERRIDGTPCGLPALESPWAIQTVGQPARLGQATLEAGGAPCVLFARAAATAPGFAGPGVWEASILADGPHPVRLDTPLGSLRCAAFGFGALKVEAPRGRGPATVTVRTAAARAPLEVPDGAQLSEESG